MGPERGRLGLDWHALVTKLSRLFANFVRKIELDSDDYDDKVQTRDHEMSPGPGPQNTFLADS